MRGRAPKLTRRQIAHAQWCERMRRKVCAKAVAARLDIDPRNLRRYLRGEEVPLEDWLRGQRFALLLGLIYACNAGAAPGGYATAEDAVRAGLETAEALTADFEAGGTIMECDGRFLVMPVTTDGKRTSLAVLVYTIPGCTLAGLFHTHPKRDKLFSAADIAGACALKTRSYMKPRDGTIRVFDCSGMSEAAQRVALTRPIAGKTI
jgi:hypothetical protein